MVEENDTSFKITDRRKFNADGTPRDYADEPPKEQAAEPAQRVADEQAVGEQPQDEPANVVSFPGEAQRNRERPQAVGAQAVGEPAASGSRASQQARPVDAAEQAYSQTTTNQPRGLPEATFLSLINMLAVEAAMHLGLIETPGEAPPGVDLEAARHMIDMLGVLEQKTRGNLSADEDKLLENILADLRMQYVALSRRR